MASVKAALLFKTAPSLVLEHFVESLTLRLSQFDITPEEFSPEDGKVISFNAAGVVVTITVVSSPLTADNFAGAMDSPLSKPVIGLLSDTLARHSRHMLVSVDTPDGRTETDLLTRLRLAHATLGLLAEWHMPAAVHWMHSNQLLTGAQYLQLVSDATPWALFAQAKVTYAAEPDQLQPRRGICLEGAADFIGRPIRFRETHLPLDEAHAAVLSFLRHAVETHSPVPHGHTFGPKGGPVFRVTYVDAYEELPKGMFELSVVSDDTDQALDGAARPSKAVQIEQGNQLPPSHSLSDAPPANPRERTRSMAIGYLMLVIMPPVGAILLMSNAIFGSNVWRTGVVAVASVALAVVVGAYTFMNNGQQTTLLFQSDIIHSTVLAD